MSYILYTTRSSILFSLYLRPTPFAGRDLSMREQHYTVKHSHKPTTTSTTITHIDYNIPFVKSWRKSPTRVINGAVLFRFIQFISEAWPAEEVKFRVPLYWPSRDKRELSNIRKWHDAFSLPSNEVQSLPLTYRTYTHSHMLAFKWRLESSS